MSVSITISGLEEVAADLKALNPKLRKQIENKTRLAVSREAIKEARKEVSGTLGTLKKLVTPGRELKQATDKGRKAAAARQAMMDLRKSIGRRQLPKWRMRNKNRVYFIVGPRSGFKVRHMLNSKREHVAATTAAQRVESGTSRSVPDPFMHRVFRRSGPMFQTKMIETGKELLRKLKT